MHLNREASKTNNKNLQSSKSKTLFINVISCPEASWPMTLSLFLKVFFFVTKSEQIITLSTIRNYKSKSLSGKKVHLKCCTSFGNPSLHPLPQCSIILRFFRDIWTELKSTPTFSPALGNQDENHLQEVKNHTLSPNCDAIWCFLYWLSIKR